jgi:hypothetical protein
MIYSRRKYYFLAIQSRNKNKYNSKFGKPFNRAKRSNRFTYSFVKFTEDMLGFSYIYCCSEQIKCTTILEIN